MLVAFLSCLVGLAAVLVALAHDEPLPGWASRVAMGRAVLGPGDVVRTDFPVVLRGYDPATVESHLRAVARAWIEASDPRREPVLPPDHFEEHVMTAPILPVPASEPASALEGTDPDADAEALRTHAALELLKARTR
ncbi:MAG: DivIVA domain-containing protein [Egibacteraceae bacterium]